MSFVSFDRVFHPSEEEKARRKEFEERLHREAVEDRANVKLVRCDDVLYRREPFRGFLGDCECCSHYNDPSRGFITGGVCTLHHIGCGYGFTCKDNDSEWAVEIKENL